MVIASIDIQGGSVVQLRGGRDLVLKKENGAEGAKELAAGFNKYGEVAVIDLDAAMGKGSNSEMLQALLPLAPCRVGGGIHSVERAAELVSLGAQKIIVGSSAFRVDSAGGDRCFGINRAFLEKLAQKIGRERVIVAVDSRNEEIVVDGWKTATGLNLEQSAAQLAPYTGELLFTCVEREGSMTGIDMAQVDKLLAVLAGKNIKLTAAGGVNSIEQIKALAEKGADVQLGMALYTGKVNLADAFVDCLNWTKAEKFKTPVAQTPALLPLIAQSDDGQVLMLGYADREALSETFKRNKLCFHSRERNKLWMKGETSGNTLDLISLRADCDRDTILARVRPHGPTCHTGSWSCFETGRRYSLELLQAIIAERFAHPTPGSYTATLDDELVREKVNEEAGELCTAKTHGEVVWEAADLFYFATTLITREHVSVQEILDELDRRHKK
jgi:phosphoribosyl-ATP pyrophosphohydrolase/phosphoribosyl-AMP cyclohydrolase